MVTKEPLTVGNLHKGEAQEELNDAIARASQAVGASDNPKAKAVVTMKIVIENGDQDGCFRKVTHETVVKEPPTSKRHGLYPVVHQGGASFIGVDPTQDGAQVKIPGVANLGAKRAAS